MSGQWVPTVTPTPVGPDGGDGLAPIGTICCIAAERTSPDPPVGRSPYVPTRPDPPSLSGAVAGYTIAANSSVIRLAEASVLHNSPELFCISKLNQLICVGEACKFVIIKFK